MSIAMKRIILPILLCVSANTVFAFSFSSNSKNDIETQLHHAKTETDIKNIIATKLVQGNSTQNTLNNLKLLGFKVITDAHNSNKNLQSYTAIKNIKSDLVCSKKAVITVFFENNQLKKYVPVINRTCL